MKDGSATKDSDLPSSSWLPIRQLVDQWRVQAIALRAMFLRPQAKLLTQCADELEAALAALLDPAPQLSENKEVDTRAGEPATNPSARATAVVGQGVKRWDCESRAAAIVSNSPAATVGDTDR